jgi:hypothetical protein
MEATVWIVQHDESPHNTVLAVLATAIEAQQFAEQVTDRFPGGVIFAPFAIGYRYDEGARSAGFADIE